MAKGRSGRTRFTGKVAETGQNFTLTLSGGARGGKKKTARKTAKKKTTKKKGGNKMPPKPPAKGPKIIPVLRKPIKKALPTGAVVTGVGPRRLDGTHTVKFRTRAGKVERKAQVTPEGHRPGKLPTEVIAAVGKSIPRGAQIESVTRRGNKYRVTGTAKGKRFNIFVWIKRPQEFNIQRVSTLNEISITHARPGVKGRTVTRTTVDGGRPTTRLGGPFRKKKSETT